jgi:outer membrane PBP1 activator LpoA protein
MQRSRVLVLLAAVLYLVLASTLPRAHAQAEADASRAEPEEEERPHVAALLPVDVPAFARFADAVRRGLIVAAQADAALPLVVYPTGSDPQRLVQIYDEAIRRGAQVVIGPLAKNDVETIARSHAVTVPTLALTVPDGDVLLPDNMYAFGVQLDAEARQIARLAISQGRNRAVVIAADNALGRRIAQAFSEEWTRSGRLIVDQYAFTVDQALLKKIRQGISMGNADMIFLALDASRARQMRPYLGKALPTYGTSQVFTGANDVVGQHDLNGVTFVDMPWLLMPDHPAVMAYPKPVGILPTADLERFYALGIDAWRLASGLLDTGFSRVGTVDGVTGYLYPGNARQFVREAVAAQFVQGEPRLLNPVSGR